MLLPGSRRLQVFLCLVTGGVWARLTNDDSFRASCLDKAWKLPIHAIPSDVTFWNQHVVLNKVLFSLDTNSFEITVRHSHASCRVPIGVWAQSLN